MTTIKNRSWNLLLHCYSNCFSCFVKICVLKNVDIKERIRVVNNYIATQPNRNGEAFASLTFDALIEKWPCQVK